MLRGAIFVVLVAVLVYVTLHVVDRLDVNRHYHNHHPGRCAHVKGHKLGSEDIALLTDGTAFITSGMITPPVPPKLVQFFKDNNIKGRIYRFDFKKPDEGARDVKLIPSKSFNLDAFRPHGLAALEDKTKGEHLVYVVNHVKNSKDTVEKFRYNPKTDSLQHLKTIQDDSMYLMNDLILVGEDKFYVTNFLYFLSRGPVILEMLAPLKLTDLVFYDGRNGTVVYPGIAGANGVTMSLDGKFVYVAAYSEKKLIVLERNPKNNSLEWRQNVDLHLMPDNVNPTQDGSALLVGGHPKAGLFMRHMTGPAENPTSPSTVLHLPLKNGLVNIEGITELFHDDGKFISGSSSAANYGKSLLIGSVINKLVYCPLGLDL